VVGSATGNYGSDVDMDDFRGNVWYYWGGCGGGIV
jgi:hypothetical protein